MLLDHLAVSVTVIISVVLCTIVFNTQIVCFIFLLTKDDSGDHCPMGEQTRFLDF